uniref:Uncharacterized protein n=1 Tax=Meloidogyne enterolobii TaxID=390850 RepID=A0A6V7W0U4_MELEN|nr:unnamed protein product [Meloidogyne enterolobii]
MKLKRITCLKSILKGKRKSQQIFFFRNERLGEKERLFIILLMFVQMINIC